MREKGQRADQTTGGRSEDKWSDQRTGDKYQKIGDRSEDSVIVGKRTDQGSGGHGDRKEEREKTRRQCDRAGDKVDDRR
jgi:hypothetical protein